MRRTSTIVRVLSAGLALLMTVIALTSVTGSASGLPLEKHKASQRKKPGATTRVTRSMIVGAQQRLTGLGYWIAGTDGKWNADSRQGLIAFQKVEGRARTGKLTVAEIQALNSASRPVPREKGFAHIEVDLARQVLFVVDADGTVSKILPVSSGNGKMFELEGDILPAVTPPGRFRVYSKLPGWRKSPLGLLYYPNYILGGIAIHGNPEVPAQPASHGCIRIPMFAAKQFSDMTPIGSQVIVYAAASATNSQEGTRP